MPIVIIVFGLPGSGKTFFATRFSQLIGAEHLSSDSIRMKLLEHRSYSSDEKLFIYEEMLRRLVRLLEEKRNVVVDATFYSRELRDRFKLAIDKKARLIFIEIRADESIILSRVKKERTDSEAGSEVYELIKGKWEPFEKQHLVLNSGNTELPGMLNTALRYYREFASDHKPE